MSGYSLTDHSMSTENFTIEAHGTGRTFGRKFDINVVFSGDQAGTNGNTIVPPSLPSGKQLTSEQVLVARGYIDHEAGHVRHSDMPLLAQTNKQCAKDGNKILPRLINAIEDVRIEDRIIDEYPGSLRNLTATTEAVNSEFLNRHSESDAVSDRQKIMTIALTWQGRKLLGYDTDTNQKCIDLLPEKLQKESEAWARAIKACRNSADVVELARRIDSDIREKQEEEGGDPIIDEPYEADGEGETGTTEVRKARSAYGKAHESSGDQNPLEIEPADALESTWRDKIDEGDRERAYRPESTASDKWHTRHDKKAKYTGGANNNRATISQITSKNAEHYEEIKREMVGKVNTMRRKLERAITAKMERNWDFGRLEGNLDSRRLPAAYKGEPNVFKAREETDDFDTSIEILIDLSGSMCGQPAYLATQVAIALAECLERTPVEYEVLGFNNSTGFVHNDPARKLARGGARPKSSRYGALDMYVFKEFDERLFDARGAMGRIYYCVAGCNSDGEAVLNAWARLRVRPSKRKILIVLSDGYPACNTSFGQGHLDQHLRDVIEMVSKKADCVGIGIMSDAVQQFYPRWQVIDNLNDLPKATMDELGKLLINDRYKPDNSDLMKAKHALRAA